MQIVAANFLLYASFDEIEKQTKQMLNAFGKDRYRY